MEKGNLEVLLFTLQSEQRANNKTPYNPKEGKTISDINRAWELLEKAEHERELVSLQCISDVWVRNRTGSDRGSVEHRSLLRKSRSQ